MSFLRTSTNRWCRLVLFAVFAVATFAPVVGCGTKTKEFKKPIEVDFDMEIVIGEDCSTDRTAEIIKEFQSRSLPSESFKRKSIVSTSLGCFFRKFFILLLTIFFHQFFHLFHRHIFKFAHFLFKLLHLLFHFLQIICNIFLPVA